MNTRLLVQYVAEPGDAALASKANAPVVLVEGKDRDACYRAARDVIYHHEHHLDLAIVEVP